MPLSLITFSRNELRNSSFSDGGSDEELERKIISLAAAGSKIHDQEGRKKLWFSVQPLTEFSSSVASGEKVFKLKSRKVVRVYLIWARKQFRFEVPQEASTRCEWPSSEGVEAKRAVIGALFLLTRDQMKRKSMYEEDGRSFAEEEVLLGQKPSREDNVIVLERYPLGAVRAIRNFAGLTFSRFGHRNIVATELSRMNFFFSAGVQSILSCKYVTSSRTLLIKLNTHFPFRGRHEWMTWLKRQPTPKWIWQRWLTNFLPAERHDNVKHLSFVLRGL